MLNKHQNISEHRVDYIVSLGLYESYCTILILLGRDSIWESGKDPCAMSLLAWRRCLTYGS